MQVDASGLDENVHMINRVDQMYNTYTIYHLLQGIVLLMLVLHLIHAVGFQPRMSIIPGEFISPIQSIALSRNGR